MRTTSSSISSSEADGAPAWRRFVLALAAAAAIGFAAAFGFVVAADPYDTGRFALLSKPGLPSQAPRTAHASRGRDPAFDAAILGNSHIQILSPAELSGPTGMSFVSLAVPGTGPRETFALLDYVLRRRGPPVRALVLGIDPLWCRAEPDMPLSHPFPFWLYEGSAWTYLTGLLRSRSLEDAGKRLAWAVRGGRRARPDGLWDYDEGFVWQADRHGPMFRAPAPSGILNGTGRFPAIEALARRLDGLPRALAIVLVLPPVHAVALPIPGTALALSEESCRLALLELARDRRSVAIVDWRRDREEIRDPENFIDPTHYRRPIARALERDIAAAIAGLAKRAGAGG